MQDNENLDFNDFYSNEKKYKCQNCTVEKFRQTNFYKDKNKTNVNDFKKRKHSRDQQSGKKILEHKNKFSFRSLFLRKEITMMNEIPSTEPNVLYKKNNKNQISRTTS